MQHPLEGKIFWQGTRERAEGTEAPIGPKFDFFDINTQAVTGLSALDCNRAREDVWAKARRIRGVDRGERFRDPQATARGWHDVWRAGDAFKNYQIPRIDFLDRGET